MLTAKHRPSPSFILAIGSVSGIACFIFFQAAYWLTTQVAQSIPGPRDGSAWERLHLQPPQWEKWIGAVFVILIASVATYIWDKLRVRCRLNPQQYWVMISLALLICSLVALLSGGF